MTEATTELQIVESEPTPPPKPKKRLFKFMCWLFLLSGIAMGLFVRGPGVMQLGEGEAVLLTNDAEIAFLGPKRRFIEGPAFVIYLPVATEAIRFQTTPRATDLEAEALTQDLVQLRSEHAFLTWSITGPEAAQVIDLLGRNEADWAEAARLEGVAALVQMFGRLTFAELQDREKMQSALQNAQIDLRRRLKAMGLHLVDLHCPLWSSERLLPELEQLKALRERMDALQGEADRQKAAIAQERAVEQSSNEAQLRSAEEDLQKKRAELQAEIEAGKAAFSRELQQRWEQAEAETLAKLKKIEAQKQLDAVELQALKARREALGRQGSRALDRAIAECVLPQLAQVSMGQQKSPEPEAGGTAPESAGRLEPEAVKPEPEANPTAPEAVKTEAGKPEPEAVKPEPGKPEPEAVKPEPGKPEPEAGHPAKPEEEPAPDAGVQSEAK